MKIGDKIEVERLPYGGYKVKDLANNVEYIGSAASTAIQLMHSVFIHEASEVRDAQ